MVNKISKAISLSMGFNGRIVVDKTVQLPGILIYLLAYFKQEQLLYMPCVRNSYPRLIITWLSGKNSKALKV